MCSVLFLMLHEKSERKTINHRNLAPGPGPDRLSQASFSGDLGDDRKTINLVRHLALLTPSDVEMIRRQTLAATACSCSLQHRHCHCVTDTDRSALGHQTDQVKGCVLERCMWQFPLRQLHESEGAEEPPMEDTEEDRSPIRGAYTRES